MQRILLLSLALTIASCVHGANVSYDAIPLWPEPTPTTEAQALAVKFKPYLDVVNGCQPYPAVDADGNTGSGLEPRGSSDANCTDTTKGQVYSRSAWFLDAYAIMYSWYMPKDSPSSRLGHRHDWENVIVWLDSNRTETATVIALAASAHGLYKKSFPVNDQFLVNGTNAKISYKSTWPINHEMGFTTRVGTQQALVQWDQLTPQARDGLENTSFGSGHVPFRSKFRMFLALAYFNYSNVTSPIQGL